MATLRVDTVSGIGTEGPVLDGGLHFRSKNYLTLPKGTTTERTATSSGISTETGSIRYNTDSNKMECYIGNKWMIVSTSSPDHDGGTRGLAIGGNTQPGGVVNKIDFINIATTGNAQDFGDMVTALFASAGMSSRTRAVISGGRQTPSNTSDIQYLTMSSTGNTIDWGVNPLNSLSYGSGAVSNQTRGITMGGYNTSNSSLDDIQFLTIASLGTINDFGNISATRGYVSSVNSPTRGLCNGGTEPAQVNTIEFVTIASTGNAQDFGDLSVYGFRTGACMSSTRGLIAFGETPAGDGQKNIDYVTIATLGNAVNFGDLTVGGQHPTGTSDSVRGVWLGRQNQSPYSDNEVIDFNTIATQGDAVDFGNLTAGTSMPATASTGHGGL